MKTWQVVAVPAGAQWHIEVKGLSGATQARSAREIEEMARDFIEEKTGEAAPSLSVTVVE